MTRGARTTLSLALLLSSAVAALAAEPSWPQWQGPARDNKSTETGLLKKWPPAGPKLLWSAKALGYGYSTVAVADGLIYTTGMSQNENLITALDLNGNVKWRVKNGPDFGGDNPGSRSTPTVDGALLYVLSGVGRLGCFDAKSGDEKWAVDLVKTFGGAVPNWGYAESVLVDGKQVICTPGGRDATMAALDKTTGKTLWTSKGLSDRAAYASCALFTAGGLRQVATLTASGVVAVEADTGRFLWRYNRPANGTANCPDVLFAQDRVFGASGYDNGGGEVQLTVDAGKVAAKQVWDTRSMVNHHGGMILLNGCIYGHSDRGGWTCLDFLTGAVKWQNPGVGKGSVTYADGMLYCLGEGGQMGLVKAEPEKFEQVSSFKVPRGGNGPYWAHPVVCGGRLYLRHAETLFAYDIAAKP